MDLSNLQPALGSKHSDNFRRGRGHGSGNGKCWAAWPTGRTHFSCGESLWAPIFTMC